MFSFFIWRYEQDLFFFNSIVMHIKKTIIQGNSLLQKNCFPEFPHDVQNYPKSWGNFGQQYFPFDLYWILCHAVLIWNISWYIIRPVICYHRFPAPYYMWVAKNMQTEEVSKVPPFDGTGLCVPVLAPVYWVSWQSKASNTYTCLGVIDDVRHDRVLWVARVTQTIEKA